ncbi:uncharacterized protein V6R79_002237 [Siganus canaliculatus]
MEDFEYSVEICDRDWDCFFAECEECNMLPPSLARLDDSGMSDIDDAGSFRVTRVQNVDLAAGFTEADLAIDGPPHCEGSPVERYLGKHGIGGMESVLSGSEEDIHLQSINMFFEKLKNVTGTETLTEPSKARAGKHREVILKEEQCSDGQQGINATLKRNIPKFNSVPARDEAAAGCKTTGSVDAFSNVMKTRKIDKSGSNSSSEPAASDSVLKTNKPAHPETKLFITEDAYTATRVNEALQPSVYHRSLHEVETTHHISLGKKKCSADSLSNPELMTNSKWKDDCKVLQPDAMSANKIASQEWSPSASVKRKRRKKRRLSAEPADSVHTWAAVDVSDSEEEQHAWRAGMSQCVSEDVRLFHFHEPQRSVFSSLAAYTTSNCLPAKIPASDIKVHELFPYSPLCDSQYQYAAESRVTQRKCEATGLFENNVSRSIALLSQNGDSRKSTSSSEATNFQPRSQSQVEGSTEVEKHPWSSVSVSNDVTGEFHSKSETVNGSRKNTQVSSLSPSDGRNHSLFQPCTAEVKSVPHSILPSTESNTCTVEVCQNDRLSAAKSVLAEDAGNSGRDNNTLGQREAEPQQQLEIGCHCTDQDMERCPGQKCPDSVDTSNANYTKDEEFMSRACPSLEDTLTQGNGAKMLLDSSSSLPERTNRVDLLLEKTKAESAASQMTHSSEMSLTGQSKKETKSSTSEDMLLTPSDVTSVSSCCTLDTESLLSFSSEIITDWSGSSLVSVGHNDLELKGEKALATLTKSEGSVSNDTTDATCETALEADDAIVASKAECEPEKAPDSKHSVFAMSSFWSEMEKLTINDILGLRTINKASLSGCLAPLEEGEETDSLAMSDSGVFSHLDESKPDQADEDAARGFNASESDPRSAGGVITGGEHVAVSLDADVHPENMMLTSVGDTLQPALPGSPQTCLRKICKNVSVHNLRALDSYSYTWKKQPFQTLNERELEKAEYLADGDALKHDEKRNVDGFTSSASDGNRISLKNIFEYFFSRKQSEPSQSSTADTSICYADGDCLPETYDHFFSEFDTENFFCPLITAGDQAKDELVPVFSYSRSTTRNMQFPEAYDHFFASSSSDDSSVESDEDDIRGPVRVVSRFSRTASLSKFSTDIYDNFFTDSDLGQNFLWKNILSFRKTRFTEPRVQTQAPSGHPSESVKPSGRPLRWRVNSVNVLGNEDGTFNDPLLFYLEDRISRQLSVQSFRSEDLQMAVANPRLGASLLPLRQSDMCLVCIAFASWVLKTANPQVGDAWKAVLLANVSALSAIRYLRKYVKVQATTSEKKFQLTPSSDS